MIVAFLSFVLAAASAPGEAAPMAERIEAVSAAFLGAPYERSPLGEGEGIDPDARYREDAFDCLTLVETAIALAHSRDRSQAERILDDIRYASGRAPSFQSRLHLMEAQWIPDLIRKGYLEEVTPQYGGEEVIWIEVELDERRWARRRLLPALRWEPELEGAHRLPVVPLQVAQRIAHTFPAGLVIDVVREALGEDLTRITHTGLIVEREGKRYVRHAALRERRVIDEPLEGFLARHAWMRKRRVTGIHLSAIRDNQDRVASLLSYDAGRENLAQGE